MFDQTAEFFFGGVQVDALFGVERGGGLVFHFQPLQPDDAKIVHANFPDLGLAQFDGLGHK